MYKCEFNCGDVENARHFLNNNHLDSGTIKIVIISESFPENPDDYFDGKGHPAYIKNTDFLFNQNNRNYENYNDYIAHGIYLTTAIKCVKKGYLVSTNTIKNCSINLEREIDLFPNVKVILLMGDFAIKSINYIWKRKYNIKIIPDGSTYKIRNAEYFYDGIRFIPSYTQTGNSFGIEKGKMKMMIEDVGKALTCIA
jgi:uracil-DNA glycosylase